MIDMELLKTVAKERLGAEYKLGAKWILGDQNPSGPVDCSGFIRWCFSRVGLLIPDGSAAQYIVSHDIKFPMLGDVGFFKQKWGQIHHVGMIFDAENVIEARGDPYNRVILRPRVKWEAWSEFTGWRRLDAIERPL